MKTLSFTDIIQLPVQQVDLYNWLINISEQDYKNFAKGHRAIGLCTIEGSEGMVNVESIGGNMLIQHYKILEKHKHNLVLHSAQSDAYLFHLIKIKVGVDWKMSVAYKDENSCLFTCEIGVIYPNRLLSIATVLVAGNYFIRKHLNEEGKRFAKDIERKFQHR